ncbi:MAG: xanthine dehydrogenase molybdopterin binding subunit, partial [Pseudomonadota bacterium]
MADRQSNIAEQMAVGKALAHDSAKMHVCGNAPYIDDINEPSGMVHLAPGLSPKAKGKITRIDLDAVRAAQGVLRVLTAADIPGKNECGPSFGGDPILADGEVLFHGQVIFAVIAETRDQARRAARLGRIEISETKPSVTVEDGLKEGGEVLPHYEFNRGNLQDAMTNAPLKMDSSIQIGGQEHFYLEGQIS